MLSQMKIGVRAELAGQSEVLQTTMGFFSVDQGSSARTTMPSAGAKTAKAAPSRARRGRPQATVMPKVSYSNGHARGGKNGAGLALQLGDDDDSGFEAYSKGRHEYGSRSFPVPYVPARVPGGYLFFGHTEAISQHHSTLKPVSATTYCLV